MPNPGGICQRLPLLRNGESTISRRLVGAACVTMYAVRAGVGAAAGMPLCLFVCGGGGRSKIKNKTKRGPPTIQTKTLHEPPGAAKPAGRVVEGRFSVRLDWNSRLTTVKDGHCENFSLNL